MFKNIGFAITGSFCTHDKALSAVKALCEKYNVIPIVSDMVYKTDTRFGNAKDLLENLERVTRNKVVHDIVQAEPIGPKNMIDVLVIAPCTGNTLSKLANAITDNAVTMVAKAHLRNNKPVVIGISSNDALGKNSENLGRLINSKNVYFVPMGQDDYLKKPNSLICDFGKIEETINSSFTQKQLQPIFITL